METPKKKIVDIWQNSLGSNDHKVEKKISFSQFRNWSKCAHLHFLISVSKEIPYPDNDYTLYGSPLHETFEKMFLEKAVGTFSSVEENVHYFETIYEKSVREAIENEIVDEEELSYEKTVDNLKAGQKHVKEILDFLDETFGQYNIIAVEEQFSVPLDIETEHYTFLFRGAIDLVIQTEDGIYHVIDWKTSRAGWSDYRKEDQLQMDQLFLYRFFFSKIYNIPLEEIRSHFVILETKDPKIDMLTINMENEDYDDLFDRIRKMVYNAFERKYFPRTALCGNFCECKKFYNSKLND